jgi:hypothetical protein
MVFIFLQHRISKEHDFADESRKKYYINILTTSIRYPPPTNTPSPKKRATLQPSCSIATVVLPGEYEYAEDDNLLHLIIILQ